MRYGNYADRGSQAYTAPLPHTFARIILQRGVSVRDVADLLGNSELMVRKHYAAWIPERQARLTKILQEAFTDKPKPKVINMPNPR